MKLVTYALLAAYTASRGAGWKLATLLTFRIQPRRRSIMAAARRG